MIFFIGKISLFPVFILKQAKPPPSGMNILFFTAVCRSRPAITCRVDFLLQKTYTVYMKKIVFCGGGTAGHIMPNIALAENFRNLCEIFYIGAGGMERELVPELLPEAVYFECTAPKFNRSFSPDLIALPSRLWKSIRECTTILEKISPSLTVSKGGYAAFPVVYASHKLRIPVVAHESDSSLGLGNRMSLPFIKTLYTPFKSTAKQAGKKGVVCATPLTARMQNGNKNKGLEIMGFEGKRPVLLCLGGSLGALTLNSALEKALPSLLSRMDVFLISGKGKKLSFARKGFNQTEFTTDISHLYAAADIAYSRAGSNTLSELTYYSVPMLLTPLVKSSRGEQLKNAKEFAAKGVAKILPEDKLTPQSLVSELFSLYGLSEKMKKHFPPRSADLQMARSVARMLGLQLGI